MKKALLTIAILLFTGLSVDVLAQRKRSEDQKPRKEAILNNKNRVANANANRNNSNNRNSKVNSRDRGGNKNYSNVNNRNGQRDYSNNKKSKGNRVVRVVDRRVYNDRGWRNTGSSFTVNHSVNRFYDYDARRGIRILVNRGYRPGNRHIWLAGHWRYSPRFRRDVWVDGQWSIRRANHSWIPGRYQRLNGVRIWVDGCWSVVY